MLTKPELLAAADAAERFPPRMSGNWFSRSIDMDDARRDPLLLRYG